MKTLQTVSDGLLVRLGTALSAAFLGYGIHADHVNVLVPAILVVAGVALDMCVGAIVKKWGR